MLLLNTEEKDGLITEINNIQVVSCFFSQQSNRLAAPFCGRKVFFFNLS